MAQGTLFFAFALFLSIQGSWCQFELQVRINDIINLQTCKDSLELIHPECETFIAKFCLREASGEPGSRSLDLSDCSLGTGGQFGPNSRVPIIKPIISSQPWPGQFQLYIKARDQDDFDSDDRDDIFIDMTLKVSNHYTAVMDVTGEQNRVQLRASLRVMCWDNYYGDSCSTFCLAQDNDENGHYTCNSDGSKQCLNGFENPLDNCKDEVDPCAESPCANNGTCISLGPFNYTCQCVSNYNGTDCEDVNKEGPIFTTATNSAPFKVSGSTITISITGVLLVVFMVAFTISTTILFLLIIKQRTKSRPLSREASGAASVKRTKLEMKAYIESTMQLNLLYDGHTVQANSEDRKRHEYETVHVSTPDDASVNTESKEVTYALNPMFQTSSSLSQTDQQQPTHENPGYSYAEVDMRYVSSKVVLDDDQQPPSNTSADQSGSGNEHAGQLPGNAKMKEEPSQYANVISSYNRLEHGQNTTQPQPRLAKLEGLGYDALEK